MYMPLEILQPFQSFKIDLEVNKHGVDVVQSNGTTIFDPETGLAIFLGLKMANDLSRFNNCYEAQTHVCPRWSS